MGLFEAFDAFRKTLWFRLLYFALFGIILGIVLPRTFALGCVIILAIGLAHFGMPYLIGERNVKRMALFALYTTLIATTVAAGFVSSSYLTIAEVRADADMNGFLMENGTAAPYQQEGASTTFTTTLTFPNATYNATNVMVYVLVQNVDPFGVSAKWYEMAHAPLPPLDPGDGPVVYTVNATLPSDQLHLFRFEIFNNLVFDPASQCPLRSGSDVTTITAFWERECLETGAKFLAGSPRAEAGLSGRVYGPITTSGAGAFIFSFIQNFVFMIFPLFTFGIVAMLFWYTRRARDVRAAREKPSGRQAQPGDFTCSNCGTDVPAEAARCPKCGALFEEPEPVTTATKVPKDAEAKPVPADAAKEPEPEAKVVPDDHRLGGK